MILMNRVAVHVGYWLSMRNVQGTQMTTVVSILLFSLRCRQYFVIFFVSFREDCSAGGLIYCTRYLDFSCSIRDVVTLLRSMQQGDDFIGRYAICVKAVLLFFVRRFY